MSEDELELDALGDERQRSFSMIDLTLLLYSQLFNQLCDKAEDVYSVRILVLVRFLLDEFANMGLIS